MFNASIKYDMNKRVKYKEYLLSDKWKKLRLEKINTHPECEKCSGKQYLQVHHSNYDNIFNESIHDLHVLCRKCHKKLHKIHRKSNLSLQEFTAKFLIKKLSKPMKYQSLKEKLKSKKNRLSVTERKIKALNTPSYMMSKEPHKSGFVDVKYVTDFKYLKNEK